MTPGAGAFVLVAEDDAKQAELIRRYLQREEHAADLAQEHGVRIVVIPVGGSPIESSPASASDPHGAEPSVAIDPLTVDNALAATHFPDGIDPKAAGPFLLTTQEHADLEVLVEKAAACLRGTGQDEGVSEVVATGRPYLSAPMETAAKQCRDELIRGGGYVGFEDSPAITPTATEQAALAQLEASMKGCVTSGPVKLALTGAGEVKVVAGPADGERDQTCLLNARRLQLRPYVAPAAFLEALPLGHAGGQAAVGLSAADTRRIAEVATLVALLTVGVAMLLTGALDTANGRAILELLRTLNRAGTTIALITHDRQIADALPRRVEILDGRIRADQVLGAGAMTRGSSSQGSAAQESAAQESAAQESAAQESAAQESAT